MNVTNMATDRNAAQKKLYWNL